MFGGIRDGATGDLGSPLRLVALATLALAASGVGALDAKANPNTGQPLTASEPADIDAALGANPSPGNATTAANDPVTHVDPAENTGADAAMEMDTWLAQSVSRLSMALERYEAIAEAGGWPTVPDGPSLEPEMTDPRVPAIRQRLQVTGDAAPSDVSGYAAPVYLTSDAALVEIDPLHYDATLAAGVRAFQARHGLFVDGVIGRRTLAALNVPVASRVKAQKINLERLKKFEPWGPSYVLVNIPGFEAHLIREQKTTLTTRVIVGEPDWPTPQLNGMISRVIVNPYWNVPKSILRREIIPRMQEDPDYLTRQNIRVYSGWHAQARELDPATIDWSGPAARIYRLRQERGRGNALGKYKFTFDNSQNIYLHDTASRGLFKKSARALSHGCVRVEKPQELAEWLLEGQGSWNGSALKRTVASGKNRWIRLENPVPVHLVYWTAWADENGNAQFRRDIYKRDWSPYASQNAQQQGT